MTSFTSNSKGDFKTCAAVAALLLVIELLLYGYQDQLSRDTQQLRALPSVAAVFRQTASGKMLFLGNSLTREGVDMDVVRQQFENNRLGSAIFQKADADDSSVVEWYYLYENSFYRAKATPNVLVTGFVRRQILDANTVKADVIAGTMGGFANVPEIFQHDIGDISGRINYVLSSFSTLYANRERVRIRFASVAFPHYEDTAQYLNRAIVSNANAPLPASTYERLQRLMNLCKQTNTLFVLVAMPIPEVYDIEDALPELLARNGAVYLDLRRIEGLEKSHFPDGYHLGEEGAKIYSRTLAAKLQRDPKVMAAIDPINARSNPTVH